MGTNELNERLFNFSVRTINFLEKLPNTPESKIIRYQLAKSSTSSGANYEESQAVQLYQKQVLRNCFLLLSFYFYLFTSNIPIYEHKSIPGLLP